MATALGLRLPRTRPAQHQDTASVSAAAERSGVRASQFAIAAALLLSELAFVAGAAWDIQWHYAIGRDRPFIPPHLLLLAGIALTGLIALAGVVGSSLSRTSRMDASDYGRTDRTAAPRRPCQ